jgi:hypothetical protein
VVAVTWWSLGVATVGHHGGVNGSMGSRWCKGKLDHHHPGSLGGGGGPMVSVSFLPFLFFVILVVWLLTIFKVLVRLVLFLFRVCSIFALNP